MLPSSMRRVVSAAPPSSLFSNLTPSNPRASTAAASFILTSNPRCQQRRRYSSSKPSSPSDSPKGVPNGEVTATQTASSTKQGGGEKRKRKSNKDANADGNAQKLPSVPSTQHVPQKSMALSTFFSLHRPMSVTHSFPKTISDDAFAQIFASRSKNNKADDVMTTLSNTVDQLEEPMRALNLEAQQESTATDANGEQMRIEVRHADGTESNVYVQLNAMSGQFLPFRPPPAPQPASATPATESADSAVAQEETAGEAATPTTETRIYKAMFTLEETVDSNGGTRILAHSPQLIEEGTDAGDAGANTDAAAPGAPRTFLERMAMREMQREQARKRSPNMLAISVRRQRKLKMKKKKYKKLMKRTRNERRKLDRV